MSPFRSKSKFDEPIIHVENTVSIKTTDPEGQQHEYHSLDEAPPEVRAEIEKLKSVPWKEISRVSSSDGSRTELVSEKTVSTYKFTDLDGNEQIYHSLDEMPPELRAAVEQAEKMNSTPGDRMTST